MANSIEVAYILAGGASSRFGESKARFQIEGQPAILRLSEQLRACGLRVVAVSQKPSEFDDIGLRTIVDPVLQSGPLAGIYAAMLDCKRESLAGGIVLSCDLFCWRSEWLSIFCEGISHGNSDVALGVSLFGPSDRVAFIPFPAYYSVALLPWLEKQLATKDRSLRTLWSSAGDAMVARQCPETLLPQSFNTVSEYQLLASRAANVDRYSSDC